MAMPPECIVSCRYGIFRPDRFPVFYDYYQIVRKPKSDASKSEPRKKEELGHYDGSHSLYGIIWQIATETGWSYRYILWEIPFETLMRMVADAPKYIEAKKKK